MQNGIGIVKLKLTLEFDSQPQEVGWAIERIGVQNELVSAMPPGSIGDQASGSVAFSVFLEKNEFYKLTVWNSGMHNRIDKGRGT